MIIAPSLALYGGNSRAGHDSDSIHQLPARHVERRTRDVTRLFAHQKGGYVRNLLGCSHPSERNHVDGALQLGIRHSGPHHGGVDESRSDDVHPDSMRGQGSSKPARQGDDAALARRIHNRAAEPTCPPPLRREVHDRSRISIRDHLARHGPIEEEGRFEIRVNLAIPVILRNAEDVRCSP